MIKALIIDDEPSALNTLRLMLERYVPEITQLQTTNLPAEGVKLLKEFQPQLLFLDIQMPVMSGFDVLRKIHPANCNIIFTTAYDQYAIQAIRFSAFDYLVKPIDADDLRNTVDRFLEQQLPKPEKEALYQNLLHNINAEDAAAFRLALPVKEGTFFYSPDEIIRLEGISNYTKFYFVNQKPLMVSKTLKEFEELLKDHQFIRTHKSHLINKKHIVNLVQNNVLTMVDQSRVEISRRRKEEVSRQLKGK